MFVYFNFFYLESLKQTKIPESQDVNNSPFFQNRCKNKIKNGPKYKLLKKMLFFLTTTHDPSQTEAQSTNGANTRILKINKETKTYRK